MPSSKTVWLHILTIAILLTGLNILKPVHIDDTPFLTYAKEFSQHPLHPYQFEYGSPHISSANNLLNPPVHLYWMGLGMALFSDDLIFLKCWLLPYLVVLTYSLSALLRRFAPTYQVPLLWLCAFSPVVLPSINYMLDIPVWSLSLFALVCTMKATERRSWGWALLAGVVIGLALQTKYIAMAHLATLGVWCVLQRQTLRGVVIVGLGLSVAVGWELYLVSIQGRSHFITQFNQRKGGGALRVARLLFPLFSQVAGVVPAVVLLGLRSFGWKPIRLFLVLSVYVLGYVLFAFLPSQGAILSKEDGKSALCLSNIIYAVFAIYSVGALLAIAWTISQKWSSRPKSEKRLWGFFGVWLILEIAGYFALSPFPAVRRVIGIIFVFTFGVSYFAESRRPSRSWVYGATIFQMVLAAFFFTVDVLDTRASREQARQLAQKLRAEQQEGQSVWYVDWYGFGYYLYESGCKPLTVNALRPKVGDTLLMREEIELERIVRESGIEIEKSGEHWLNSGCPYRVSMGYYGGRTPIESQGLGQYRVCIYRITQVSD